MKKKTKAGLKNIAMKKAMKKKVKYGEGK